MTHPTRTRKARLKAHAEKARPTSDERKTGKFKNQFISSSRLVNMFSQLPLLTFTLANAIALSPTRLMEHNRHQAKVKSQFEEVGNHHYFRKTGRMIGAASFPHIAYEINLNLLQEEIETVCRCSKLRLKDFFRIKHEQKAMSDPEFWTNYRQRWKALGGNKITLDITSKVCEDLKEELQEIRRSFDPIHGGGEARAARGDSIFNQEDLTFDGRHHDSGTNAEAPIRRQRFAVSDTILLISGIASLFAGWQLKSWWEGTQDGGIVERLDEQEVLTSEL